MNGLGVSALLIAMLRPAPAPSGPPGGALLRLGLMLAVQLMFFLVPTLVVAFPQAFR
ncbi:hypothetical protein GCM10011504_41840 [Siccirubricoccus deserti]|uniref:Uncharacterized protein n=1 Tax=Siccirubricoccus deserti TaxID=2013562 RepID=A0A9X0R2Y0_9PROT|nr:hypothetical protein [Siccirubricoccus deserti]MBC4017448.1 hypothetical protein [Siccirubricoccus deserti]GGC59261.1 hypothetical protein GCM10011504_41840 [Siccirubricoccus deserti]